MCVYDLIWLHLTWLHLIWFDLTSLDLTWPHLIWFDFTWFDLTRLILFLFIRNGSESHLNSLYFILFYLILSYLTLLYLILFILNYYIIWCYLCINMWCDTQCCWLINNIYHYYSIITLISEWLDSSILCCWEWSFGSCKSPTWYWS